jgi:transposase
MKAYSEDLRRKVLDVIERGLNKSEAARLFGVSLSSVKRYAKMARGQAACPWEGARQAPQDRRARQAALGRLLKKRPAASLSERREFLEQVVGVRVSESTISRS